MPKNDPKRVIEAALFMSGRAMTLKELGSLVNVAALGFVKGILDKLRTEYDERNSAITIFESDGSYSLNIRSEYVEEVMAFTKESEVTPGALKILAYVSKNEGMVKSDIVKRLGTSVYQHVFELKEKGFVITRKFGRSSKVYTTNKFKEYFRN